MKETLRDLRRFAEEDKNGQRLPPPALGIPRDLLPDRAGGNGSSTRSVVFSGALTATTGWCSRRRSGSASRSAATRSSSPRARPRTATAPSASCTRASAGPSIAPPRACRPSRTPDEHDARRRRRRTARGARGRRGQGRRLRARPPLGGPQLPRAAPPRPRRLPLLDGRRVAGARDRERGPDPGDAVRRWNESRGPHHPGPRRYHPRPLAARPDRRRVAREPHRHRAGGRHAARADARCRRARPFLPRRPRRRRDARRHGRDERSGHDHRPLRQDARQRAGARGRPGRRAGHPHGNAGRENVRGL